MAKRVSTRRVKKHRQYTYEEAADAIGVTASTVRTWRSLGLTVMDQGRPHYILGEILIDFVARRQIKRTSKMGPDQMFCLACRKPQKPLGAMADYVPITDTRGRLVALCGVCEGVCQRFATKSSLAHLSQFYDIAIGSGSQA